MRIIHVVNVRWFNATAWYGVYLAKLMADAGHEVLVLALPGSPPALKARSLGLAVSELPLNSATPWSLAHLCFRLARTLTRFKPDLVNCHRGESFIVLGLLKGLYRDFKLVRTRGDQRLPKDNRINRWLHTRVADAVVATNARMQTWFTRHMNVPEDRVHLIPGGVDTGAFRFDDSGRDRIRKEWGLDEHHFALGLLGRFDRVKGQKELIQAVARLVHERGLGQVRLILLGFATATSQEEVETWIRDCGIEDQSTITGKRTDLAACISALDLGVVPSLWSEAIARAALEIMACKVPIIGSRVGVMPDLLSDAALLDPGDVGQLSDRLQACAQDPGLRQRLAREQSERMQDLSHHHFLHQSTELFQSLMQASG